MKRQVSNQTSEQDELTKKPKGTSAGAAVSTVHINRLNVSNRLSLLGKGANNYSDECVCSFGDFRQNDRALLRPALCP